ncbi:MAG TPA: DNA polymerase III subunit delta' [Armatimonadota bacterium]|nr:DNA polymerase III subunit delta' [Armatimonadota bacterium]
MRLCDIEAQEVAVRALRSSIQRSSVAHAYLFTGPRSTGKTSAALALASALNCADRSPEGDACGTCLSCIRIEAGTDADVQVISPAGDQTKIDQMHEMIRSLSFAPLSGRYRVFIIEQADTLNPSSENAILKILEEPPPYAVLILISNNPNSLLPTIRSRCLIVRFRRAGTAEVGEVLRRRFDLPEDEARVIAACSQGAVGRAFKMASDPEFAEERQVVLEAVKQWVEGPPVLAMRTAEALRDLAQPKKDDPDQRTRIAGLTQILEHILSWYADLLALKVRGSGASVINADYEEYLKALAERYNADKLRAAIRSIMQTRRYLEGNITPQLALENMFFDLRPDSS